MSLPNLSALAVRERSLTLFLLLLSLMAGVISFLELGRAEDPAITMQALVVTATWPGASNADLEALVVRPLENRIQEVENLYRVETSIRDSRADIVVTFHDYTTAAQFKELKYQIRKRMQDVAVEMPAGVHGPYVNDDFADTYFSLIAVTAPGVPLADLSREAERIRYRLRQQDGVLKVNMLGERPQRVYIDFDNGKLINAGISVAAALAALDDFNRIYPAGHIESGGQKLWLRTDADLANIDRLASFPLRIGNALVPLATLAEVRQGYEEPAQYMIRANGQDAVVLGLVMQPGYNGVTLGASLADFLQQERMQLPVGMQLVKLSDQSEAIDAAVSMFQLKFLVAVAVVMGVGLIALGWRAGMIVGIVVPITLGLTFLLMKATHVNLDRITLGALIIALGLLVDDAIIAIEMMLVKLEQGWSKVAAASHAWNVTAAPMLFGTLITMFGFVPIGFAKSGVGEYAGNIFWVLAFSLLISWWVAVTFAPYLGVQLLPAPLSKGQAAADTAAHDAVYNTRPYQALRSMITRCVKHRRLTVMATAGVLLLAFAGLAGPVEKQFFPGSDRPEAIITVNLPAGTSVAVTDQVVKRLEQWLAQQKEVDQYATYVGAGAPRFFISVVPEHPDSAFAKLIVVARDSHARDRLVHALQQRLDAGDYAEARIRVNALLFGPAVQWPVSFRVVGPDPLQLRRYADEVARYMKQNPHIVEPIREWDRRVPRLHVALDNARTMQHGLTPADVSRQMLFRTDGIPVTSIRQDIRQVPLWARVRDAEPSAPVYELLNEQGKKIPLSQVGNVEVLYEEALVRRINGEKFIDVMSDVEGAQPQDVTQAIWATLAPLRAALPVGYHLEIGGSYEQSAKAEASINRVFPLMLALMLICIMLQMRSFSGTFVVLATAPLGVIGAVISLLIFDQSFGFVAMLGLIGLGGILMRNTLILTQQVRDNLRDGLAPEHAIIEAAVMRARPVGLTALAAALAFIPLLSDRFWGPLAYVLIGGVIVGTVITLLFVPALYAMCVREHKAPGEPCKT